MFQREVLFPGKHLKALNLGRPTIASLQSVWVETSCGKVEAWFMPTTVVDKQYIPTVMFGHGNGELIDHWPSLLAEFNRLGLHVLLVEYPGYGRSEGSPSQKTILETFIAAYDWLLTQPNVDRDSIIGYGRSLGGGAVCLLSQQRPLKALILQSTFVSVKQFAKNYCAPSFLIRDPFDNLAILKSFPGPVLYIHGRYDYVIPYKNSVTLQQHTPNSQLITYECHHNDCPPDWTTFWRDIKAFLVTHNIIEVV